MRLAPFPAAPLGYKIDDPTPVQLFLNLRCTGCHAGNDSGGLALDPGASRGNLVNMLASTWGLPTVDHGGRSSVGSAVAITVVSRLKVGRFAIGCGCAPEYQAARPQH